MNSRKYDRVVLFIDYENFTQTLHHRMRAREWANLEFSELLDALEEKFGPVHSSDCIVVANFTHYDSQRGGLNRVATLIHVDSFESRTVRRQTQSSPGKKHVMENAADMRIAYEIGRHVTANPAPLYLICSGDKAFAPVARALIEAGVAVVFLFPDPYTAAVILKEEFQWVSLEEILPAQDESAALAEGSPGAPSRTSPSGVHSTEPAEVLVKVISRFRHEFTAPVPIALIQAMAGPGQAGYLIERARSQGKVDLWRSPEGIECISRQEERLSGKVIPLPVRMDLVHKAILLRQVAQIGEDKIVDPTLPGWRAALRQAGGYSNNQAKAFLQSLLDTGILKMGALQQPPDLSLDRVFQYLKIANPE